MNGLPNTNANSGIFQNPFDSSDIFKSSRKIRGNCILYHRKQLTQRSTKAMWGLSSLAIAAGLVFGAQAACAQSASDQRVTMIDENGVDWSGGGRIAIPGPTISVGGREGGSLSWSEPNEPGKLLSLAIPLFRTSFAYISANLDTETNTYNITVNFNEGRPPEEATCSTFPCTLPSGAVLERDAGQDTWTHKGISGETSVFIHPSGSTPWMYYLNTLQIPNGFKTIVEYDNNGPRPLSLRTSDGYIAKFTYQSNQITPNVSPDRTWYTLSSVKMYNLASTQCSFDGTPCGGTPLASLTYIRTSLGGNRTETAISDHTGQTWKYTATEAGSYYSQLESIKYPGSTTNDETVTMYSDSGDNVIDMVIRGKSVRYRYKSDGTKTTYIDALGQAKSMDYDPVRQRPTSIKDELSRVTTLTYGTDGRLSRVTRPEGDYVEYAYDTRGNTVQTKQVAKPGSGLADIVTSAGFPATCGGNLKTCNKPLWTKDALGNQSDYTYDAATGLVTSITQPAGPSGTRPQTRYSYTPLQAYFKNGGSAIVASGQPEYRLTSTSTCLSTASCVGTADEMKTVIDYGPQTAGVANNLLPISVTQMAGDASISATSTSTYDETGNRVSVDGSLSGSADTTVYRYDGSRRPVGTIAPDPDGAGPLPNPASRVTYDVRERIAKIEDGTTSGQSLANWNAFSPAASIETTFDAGDRKLIDRVKGGDGQTYSLFQYSYDADGRVTCAATRMNPAAYGSLPADACTLGTQGTQGKDRIAKYTYDALDRVTQVQNGYGSTDQVSEGKAYNPDGTVAYVVDASSNRTSYEYDGFGRLVKTRYPSPTSGSNLSSTTDFEQLTYGDNVHVTGIRLRDGSTTALTYDNLGRLTSRTPAGDFGVSFEHNLLGMTTAVKRPGDGVNVTLSYDALGRLTSETQPFGAIVYTYALPTGSPTRLTWSDGLFADYDYDTLGRMTRIRENGASSGIGVLAIYEYDSLGRRSAATYGNGSSRTYAYDPAGRLSGLRIDLAGTGTDQVIGQVGGTGTPILYNAASQAIGIVRSNTAYNYSGRYNVDRSYTANGLNQYTAAGSTAFSYDANGNLAGSGSTALGYDRLNQLRTSGATSLRYDGLGRLIEYNADNSTRMYYSGANLAAEVANSSGTVLRRYVPGPGVDEPVVWYEGSGTADRRWLQADERGSVIAVSDGSGTAIALNAYDEHGIPRAGNLGRFQYTGQTFYPELGLYNFKARMYSPTLGRFMQTDPIGYGDGLNWHTYVGGDPINRTDPSGLAYYEPTDHVRYLACSSTPDACSGEGIEITVNGGRPKSGHSGNGLVIDACGPSAICGRNNIQAFQDNFGGTYIVAPVAAAEVGNGVASQKPQNDRFVAKPVDYCGAAGSEGVPEGMAATSFQGPCIKHDDCYGTLGKTQEQCDQGLGRDILNECKRTGGWLCALSSYVYYRALAGIPGLISPGKAAYDNAQRATRSRMMLGGRP